MVCSACRGHPECQKIIECQQRLKSSQWLERLFRTENQDVINKLLLYAKRHWRSLKKSGGLLPEELVNQVLCKLSYGVRNIPDDLDGRTFFHYVCEIIRSDGDHEHKRLLKKRSRQVKTGGEMGNEDGTEADSGWDDVWKYEHSVSSGRDKITENTLIADELLSQLHERILSNSYKHTNTQRLLDVLQLKLNGESGGSIAKKLDVSPATVSEDERALKIITIQLYWEQGFLHDLVNYPILKPFKRFIKSFEASTLSSKPPHYRVILHLKLKKRSLSHTAKVLQRLYKSPWSSEKVSLCLTEMLSWLLNPPEMLPTKKQRVAKKTATTLI